MKQQIVLLLSASAFLLSVSTFAHDPSEHTTESEKPDCSAMQNMDHSKMDMNETVMQAMMKKCMKDMHGKNTQTNPDHAAQESRKETTKPEK